MHDLIFVSMENWDDIWRRNQFICAGLAGRCARRQILFVGLSRDYTHALRARDFGCFAQPVTWKVPGFNNITVTHPPKFFPSTLTAGRLLNEAIFRRHVRKTAAKLGMQRPVLWLNPHSAVHMVGQTDESAVIYDITDDWTQMTQRPWLTSLIREQDQALCAAADAVIVCSQRLRELKAPLTRSLHLIPNGVDTSHYQDADAGRPLPAEAAGWTGPVLGYTGTIHPDRVDLPLVEALARRLPKATVVMVGPVMIAAAERQRLETLGNVVFTGPKPYAEIPDYMRCFDVCITPHLVTPFTESLNPIKLWEYLACGKPIIATPVAGFRDYPELVYLAEDAEKFACLLESALAESPSIGQQRRAVAGKHTWEGRIDMVEAVMAEALAGRADKEVPTRR